MTPNTAPPKALHFNTMKAQQYVTKEGSLIPHLALHESMHRETYRVLLHDLEMSVAGKTRSRLSAFEDEERLCLMTAGLIQRLFEDDRPLDLIAMTMNLRADEKPDAGMHRVQRSVGFSDDGPLLWTGVLVPGSDTLQRHMHLFVGGIELFSSGWYSLRKFQERRNTRLARSVSYRWTYGPEGWLGYINGANNLGQPGAKVIACRHVQSAAAEIGRDGFQKIHTLVTPKQLRAA